VYSRYCCYHSTFYVLYVSYVSVYLILCQKSITVVFSWVRVGQIYTPVTARHNLYVLRYGSSVHLFDILNSVTQRFEV
jgi:hypothetical protein